MAYQLGLSGPIDGRYAIEIETAYVLAFFDQSLALRIRDLLFDPPGLLALHHIESKRFMDSAQRRASAEN